MNNGSACSLQVRKSSCTLAPGRSSSSKAPTLQWLIMGNRKIPWVGAGSAIAGSAITSAVKPTLRRILQGDHVHIRSDIGRQCR